MKWNSYIAGCFFALLSPFLCAQEAPVNIKKRRYNQYPSG